jgi:transcriptional regulator with XRE-family HTH domain
MPSPQGPLLPRRRLGAELRRLRGDRTLDEVAAETLISTSKLSRLENGQGVPQPRDIRDLINFYNADRPTAERLRRWMNDGRRQAWWKEYSSVLSESVDTFLDYESGASVIRIYAPMVLPGLLQTEAYARRLLTTLYPQYGPDEIENLVQVRLRRQETVLRDDDDATRLLAVIDEAAIRRALALGKDEDARDQLVHVREISRRNNVSIRILPLDAGLHAGLMGIFTVFQFADDIDRDVVSVETHSGDRYLEEQSSVLEYLRLFDAVTHRALDNSGSRALLTRLVDSLPAPQEKQ